jgi:hypothetical protein
MFDIFPLRSHNALFPTESMALIVTTTITNVDTWNSWLPASLLFPPLTTLFEPPTDCSTEWLQNPLATNNVKSGFHDFCVTGLSGTVDCVMDYDTFIPTDYFGRCRPDKHAMTLGYSPGICTSGQTVAAIIERQYKSSTYWMGRCCDRLLLTIYTPYLHPYLHVAQGYGNVNCGRQLYKDLFDPHESSCQFYNHMDPRKHDCHGLCL